jgi:hypothetical protein
MNGAGEHEFAVIRFHFLPSQLDVGKIIMNRLANLALTLLAGTACVAAFANGQLEEWEMTTTVNGGGMPGIGGAMPGSSGQKMIVCQKKMDRAQPPPPPAESNCKYTSMSGSGDKGMFTMECKGNPPNIPASTMKGEGRANADTMEGKMIITTGGHEVTMNYSGKRTGTCDKEGSKMAGGSMLPGMDMQSMMDPRNRPPQRNGGSAPAPAVGDRAPQGAAGQEPGSATKDPAQDAKKDEPKDVAGKAVDAAKKAIGGLLSF